MSTKQLTAKVRLDASQAERKLQNIASAIDKINSAVGKNTNLYGKVSSELAKVDKQTKKVANSTSRIGTAMERVRSLGANIRTKVSEWATQQRKVQSAAQATNSAFGSIWGKLKGIAATYLGIMGMRAAVQTSDTITSSENKLNYLNGGDITNTKETMDKMYTSAQKVRMSYTDMMANVSKSMTLAGDAFQDNIDNAIRFQEIMAEAYAVGGASAAEMSSSMYQMIQALGSGILAGDELRSVREGAPLAYKAIEEFAQGVYNCTDSLKDMASEGMITSDIVVAAIMNSGNKLDSAFAQTKQTFAQTWEQIKNVAKKSFEPVSHMMRDTLNNAVDDGLIDKLESVFTTVSKVLQIIATVVINTINWIADNWDTVKNWIVAGLLVLAGMWIWQAGVAIVSFVAMLMAMTPIQWMLLVILVAVLALVYVFYLWKTGAIDTCQAIVTALFIVGAAVALIGLIFGSWITVIVGLVIAAIGLIIKYLDYCLGAVYVFLAAIWNIFVGVVNAIIQYLWAYFVEPWIGIIEWVLNVFNGGFNSFGDAVKNLLGNIISWFLSLGTVVTKIIDAIFGTNWTAGLNSLKDNILKWGKNETAITLSREAPTVLNRIEYGNAWNTGMEHGSIAKNWVNDLGSQFQMSGGGLNTSLDSLGGKLGLNFGQIFPDDSGLNESGYDPSKILAGIGDDTGKIADSMDLTQEDMEYLRRIADMEWKKEFTTATIQVDMSNYNTITKEVDADGFWTLLTDTLTEELDYLANGVYAG